MMETQKSDSRKDPTDEERVLLDQIRLVDLKITTENALFQDRMSRLLAAPDLTFYPEASWKGSSKVLGFTKNTIISSS